LLFFLPRLDWDEWGNCLLDTNPGFQPFGFAGGLYDPDLKLHHLGAREYDPTVGRWLQPDPLGLEGGLNLYAYCSNEPINHIDPSGLANIYILLGTDNGSKTPVPFTTSWYVVKAAEFAYKELLCMYPNAHVTLNYAPTDADFAEAFSDPNARGIVYIGHAAAAFLQGAGQEGFWADDKRITAKLDFIFVLGCEAACDYNGKNFFNTTEAKFCWGYRTKIPAWDPYIDMGTSLWLLKRKVPVLTPDISPQNTCK
jgi:RHS repeat-associated protein